MHRHIRNHGVSPKAKRKKYLEESISRPSVYDYSDLNQADYDDSSKQIIGRFFKCSNHLNLWLTILVNINHILPSYLFSTNALTLQSKRQR